MKKVLVTSACIILALMISLPVFAGGSSKINVKYPIILIHGWAGSDAFLGAIPYFWGIESNLESKVKVGSLNDGIFVANTVNAFNTDDQRGPQLRQFVLQVLAVTGAQKVNIIGHSMGGTTSRYMVSCFADMKLKVASITSVATPHRGTSAAQLILKINAGTMGALQWVMDNFWGKLVSGDAKSRFIAATKQLTPENMVVFNQYITNVAGIRYFSYADKYYGVSPAPFNNILYPFYAWMKDREGDNDGVVPVSSMIWGEYRGCETGLFGCDHGMIINHLMGLTPGFDAKAFYVKIAKLLSSSSL
ncbi:MAG: alpha/beta fold hydrolase [Spirochaetes bacterium]|jgi:triacylglycerol lipase|nr:alpha/beta fold hydrolase [Spirochaetota bacterium]